MLLTKVSKKVGLSPGSLVFVGEKRTEEVAITLLDYDAFHAEERQVKRVEDCVPYMNRQTVTWIDIVGLHDAQIIEELGRQFDLHPLLLEDIMHTGQRPKMEDFEDHLFVVLKMLSLKEGQSAVEEEQISLITAPGLVISLQERQGDIFDPVRERIRKGKGRMRSKGADYLAYALMDTVVDNYFHILERIGEDIEVLHEQVVTQPTIETLQGIQNLKRQVLYLRKSVWPLREVVSGLARGESPLISQDVSIFLRDVHDHTIQVIDGIETFREMLSGLLDLYLSGVSNKMNEAMKVLTVIATLFIPMTFLAGIYGMNFKNMPELEWPWAYPALWGVLLVTGAGMVFWFRRKKWL